MIGRFLFIITVLFIVSAASLGIRRALQPPVMLMIVPGATQIEVLQPSTRDRVIMYHLPGPAYAWRAMVERDLATSGWARPVWWRPRMRSAFKKLYVSSPWFGTIWDSVELDGDPNVARISVRRRIEFPWRWKRWLLYVSQHIAA
jgi:hypothetical protein